jgi:hypothetical protein
MRTGTHEAKTSCDSTLAMDSEAVAPLAAAAVVKWRVRNCINLEVGTKRKKVLPLLLHILSDDLEWFNATPALWIELLGLIKEKVLPPLLSATAAEAAKTAEDFKSRKKARRDEKCVQGEGLQFTYGFRMTRLRFAVLTFNDAAEDEDLQSDEERAAKLAKFRPAYSSLPVHDTTLLIWVYRFVP